MLHFVSCLLVHHSSVLRGSGRSVLLCTLLAIVVELVLRDSLDRLRDVELGLHHGWVVAVHEALRSSCRVLTTIEVLSLRVHVLLLLRFFFLWTR